MGNPKLQNLNIEGLLPKVRNAAIYPEIMGSDNCPIELVLARTFCGAISYL